MSESGTPFILSRSSTGRPEIVVPNFCGIPGRKIWNLCEKRSISSVDAYFLLCVGRKEEIWNILEEMSYWFLFLYFMMVGFGREIYKGLKVRGKAAEIFIFVHITNKCDNPVLIIIMHFWNISHMRYKWYEIF